MIGQTLDLACKGIISPDQFYHRNDIVRPTGQYANSQKFQRIVFQATNQQNKRIQAMIIKRKGYNAEDTVLYLHGNGGCKLQCSAFANLVLYQNVNVICFDFIGCGNSQKGYLTYGIKQSQDIKYVLQQSKKYININRLTVWGRSMGALSAIIYCQTNYQKIHSLILDSPFQSLQDIIINIIKQKTKLPEYLAKVIMFILKSNVETKLSEKLFEINYLQKFKKFSKSIPVLLFYSNIDETVPAKQVKKYFNISKGQKQILQIPYKHQQDRGQKILRMGIKWIKKDKPRRLNKIKLSHWHDDIQVQSSSSYYCTC